jgi:RNA processing factor Prp31
MAELRSHLSTYLKAKMLVVAPNLYTLIGETVGARLINKAGYDKVI